MKIHVDAATIAQATLKDSHHCMIADAIHAAIPDAQYVLVDVQSIRYSRKDQGVRYTHLTPLSVQRRILDFDQGKAVAPFTFTLPTVHQTRKMGWVGQANRKTSRKGKRYNKTGRKRPVVGYRERAYGLRNIPA